MTEDLPPQDPQPARGDDEKPGAKTSLWSRPILFAAPVLGALALVVLVTMTGSGPRQTDQERAAVPVRYVSAIRTDVLPRAIGYGTVAPRTSWAAVTEVSGKIIYKNPNLRPGLLLTAGTEILRIDPTDYELELRRLEANIAKSEASLADIKQQEENTRASLAIENRALELAEADLQRNRALRERGTISQAALDQMERSTLQQRQTVQNLRNQIAVLPIQAQLRESEVEAARVQLEEAKRNVERTVITLPIDGRVLSVSIEENQFTGTGQSVATVDGVEVAEISARVQIDRITPLFPEGGILEGNLFETLSRSTETVSGLFERLGFTAGVALRIGTVTVRWDADVIRIEGEIDPKTRTVGFVVAVEDPYARANPANRPPLTRNMFVEVEIRGSKRENQLVIPRAALRQSQVHILSEDDRLEIRDVEIAFEQGHIAVISKGVSEGERVIISDLSPSIPAMKLTGTEDNDLAALIGQDVRGEVPVR